MGWLDAHTVQLGPATMLAGGLLVLAGVDGKTLAESVSLARRGTDIGGSPTVG